MLSLGGPEIFARGLGSCPDPFPAPLAERRLRVSAVVLMIAPSGIGAEHWPVSLPVSPRVSVGPAPLLNHSAPVAETLVAYAKRAAPSTLATRVLRSSE